MRVSALGEAEAIAFAPDRVEEARAPGIVAHRAPQGDDVVVDRPQRGLGLEAADLLDDVEAGHDFAAARRQHPQNEDVVGRELGGPRRPACRQRAKVERTPPRTSPSGAGRVSRRARRSSARTRASSSCTEKGLGT